jgi:MFS family permease
LDGLIFRKLLPLLVLAYVISFIDRTNIALAKASLSADLGISPRAYGFGAGLFFLSYASMEIPSNLIMHRIGARFWIARIMVVWGVLSAGMAFITGETSFYAMRLLLGVAEAGLFPGVMLYLTYWFGPELRAKATGYFLIGVCVANIIGGPLAALLLMLDGSFGLRGWQWMFLLEGLPAVVLGFVVWRLLPDGPSDARWLSHAEADRIKRRSASQGRGGSTDGRVHSTFLSCLKDAQIWLAIAVYFCHQIAIYTVIFFLPSIIGAWGRLPPLTVGLLNSAPWIAALLGTTLLPRHASSAARSRLLLPIALALMSAGLLVAAFGAPVAAMAGFCLTGLVFFLAQSIIFAYPSSRLQGAALAGGLALVNTCGLVGGFLGPSVMGWIEQTTGSAHNGLLIIAGLLIAAALIATQLRMGHETEQR